MDLFGSFLKSVADTLDLKETTDNQNSTNNNTNDSELPRAENATVAKRMNSIKNQAREDDDEEFETRGRRNRPGATFPNNNNNNNGVGISGAILGLSALALGGFVAYKAYSSKDPKLSKTSDEIIQKLKEIEVDSKELPVIGLDCQWTLTFDGTRRNKIALLQLASHKGTILLIQINKLFTYPEELKVLLRNRNIIKAGIEGLKDAKYLLEDYGLIMNGTFDLRFLAEETGHRPESLAKLANKILGIELDKNWEVVASDWDKDVLDDDQIAYAEKAVKASVDIFMKLLPYVVTNVNRPEILNFCAEYVDRSFIFRSENY